MPGKNVRTAGEEKQLVHPPPGQFMAPLYPRGCQPMSFYWVTHPLTRIVLPTAHYVVTYEVNIPRD